jgi:hypothetical protein
MENIISLIRALREVKGRNEKLTNRQHLVGIDRDENSSYIRVDLSIFGSFLQVIQDQRDVELFQASQIV